LVAKLPMSAPAERQAHRHRRIEMATRHRAQGIDHGQHREAEGQGHAGKADTELGKARREHRAAAAA
jgi:hypothetical protein